MDRVWEDELITSDLRVGSICKFGSYWQNGETSNGKKPIEWIILDTKGTSILLISKYALDSQAFDSSYSNFKWEGCSLRKWLNETFLNNAFSTEEQKQIKNTTVSNDNNQYINTWSYNNTNDKVFLLSILEVNNYFRSDYARKCAPTDYAIAQGASTSSSITVGGRSTCCWWLRSPGIHPFCASYVNCNGSVYIDGCSGEVRPALWIDAEKIIEKAKEKAKRKAQQKNWRLNHKCQYCGGSFKGLFKRRCSVCGKEQDY